MSRLQSNFLSRCFILKKIDLLDVYRLLGGYWKKWLQCQIKIKEILRWNRKLNWVLIILGSIIGAIDTSMLMYISVPRRLIKKSIFRTKWRSNYNLLIKSKAIMSTLMKHWHLSNCMSIGIGILQKIAKFMK